jgi:hypothetical protein
MDSEDTPRRARALRFNVVLGALALVVGFGIASVPRLLDGGDEAQIADAARGNPRAIPTAPAASRSAPSPVLLTGPTAPEAPAPASPTPTDAVASFLRAEIEGDFKTSFGLLAAGDRAAQGSHAGWTAAHAQLPVVRHFSLGAARLASDRAEVDTTLGLKPELGPVVGLVPQTAFATWVALAEDGGWRVDYAESTLTPQYVDAGSASGAARQWVVDREGCRVRARAALLGVGILADDHPRTRRRGPGPPGTALARDRPGRSPLSTHQP